MRVGFDHLPAATHFPGVGRYARELVRALAALGPEESHGLELGLLEVGGARRRVPRAALGLEAARVPVRRFALRAPRRGVDPLLRLLGADRLVGGASVFHRMQAGWPPLARATSVLAVSELPRPGAPEEAPLGHRLRAEGHLLVFSDHAAHELVGRFGIHPERISRVHVGCDHWQRDLAALGSVPPRDDPPLVLVLGALRAERQHGEILDAFDRMLGAGTKARLVLAGHGGDNAENVRRRLSFSSGRASIRWEAAPSERELAELVARASLLVHLSGSEATPVTPLEAFAAGTPVLASDLPAFREALGDLATYVPANLSLRHRKALPELLAAGIASAADPAVADRRRAIAGRHGWRASALEHLAVYRRLT